MTPNINKIERFANAYFFLSNFYNVQVTHEDITYPSVEHAYQAAKTLNRVDRQCIANLASAGYAKSYGKKVALRADWEQVKISIMRELLIQKFNIPELRDKLLKTQDMELIEGNYWSDTFWGVCKGVGENHLGKLLMEIRKQLKVL